MPRGPKGKQRAANSGTSRDTPSSSGIPRSTRPNQSSSKSNFVWDETRVSKWTPEAIAKKLKEREDYTETRRKKIEALKNDGNKLYQAGDYEGALVAYATVLKFHGANPTIFSNMAQTLLKVEEYERAHMMATEALKREPANLKTRYRRAMARKGLGLYIAALADLSTIVSVDSTLAEARQELQIVTGLIQEHNGCHDEPYTDDYDAVCLILEESDPTFPSYDLPPYIFEEDDVGFEKESEDAKHKGNGIACKYYNRGTCLEGHRCEYSHSPDDKSQRDKLGRNVCNYYLYENCIFGSTKCYYLHDKSYLGSGWWDDKDTIARAQAMFGPGLEPHHLGSLGFNGLMNELLRSSWQKSNVDKSSITQRFDYSEKAHEKRTISANTTSQADQRFVVVLALEHDLDGDFQKPTLSALRTQLPVKIARSSADAFGHLTSPHLSGIFTTDGAIATPRHSKLLSKIIEYVKAGGRFVVGGGFSTFVQPNQVLPLFTKFGLRWKNGDYYRTTFSLNQSSILFQENPTLPASYSMKAVDLTGVDIEHAIYLPTDQSRLQSLVWAPQPITNRTNPPAAYAPVEKGFLGYIGDVNWEDESTTLLLSMLGLLDTFVRPQGPQARTPMPKVTSPLSSVPMPCSSRELSSPDFILLLSLEPSKNFSAKYAQFLSTLGERINYEQAVNTVEACSKLTSPHLKGVFVTDGGILSGSALEPLFLLTQYVRQKGGNVIFGAEFGDADETVITQFFDECWGLRWEVDAMERITGVVNFNHSLASKSAFPPAYTMKGAQVNNVEPKDAIVVSYTSLVEMPDKDEFALSDSDDGGMSPLEGLSALIATTKKGSGRLGYIGDTKMEQVTIDILLELLCPKAPSPPVDPSYDHVSVFGLPSVMPPPKPFVIVLTFGHGKEFAKTHDDFLDSITMVGLEAVHGLSVQRNLELIKSPHLKAIFVPYADIVEPEHAYLVSKLVEFTKSGGNVIFGGYFARSVQPDRIETLFCNWGLKWKKTQPASLVTNMMVGNIQNPIARMYCPSPLPQSRETTALQLSGISEETAVYVMEGAVSQKNYASVVFAGVGDGSVGYIGETSFSQEHAKLVLAMLQFP